MSKMMPMIKMMKMIKMTKKLWMPLAVLLIASCSPDPYNVLTQTIKVEKIVMGEAALDLTQPRAGTNEYILYEGTPSQDGGIVYHPFYLTDIEINPAIGGAILARKSRYGEVFGLLSRGAAGEAATGRLIARTGLSELTMHERSVIDMENSDREVIVQSFLKGKQIPAADAAGVRRVFAYSRYRLMPSGVWVEEDPGKWVIKGGGFFRSRVMAREPIAMPTPVELEPLGPAPVVRPTAAATPSPSPPRRVLESPRPRVR